MNKLMLIALLLVGCTNTPNNRQCSEMQMCRDMCLPNVVKYFAPAEDGSWGFGGSKMECRCQVDKPNNKENKQ